MSRHTTLLQALHARRATVCVVGQGYVGLSVAAAAATDGFEVVGLDVDGARVAALERGQLVVPGVDEDLYREGLRSGRLAFTTEPAAIGRADVVLICMPTPVVDHRPDLSLVEGAARTVATWLGPGALVVLESTTYPGTTDQLLRPLLEADGRRAGHDFFLAYSPERIDPGNRCYGFRTTPRVVGGSDTAATELVAAFYGQLVDEVHVVSSARAAEMAKLLENTFRMVNIALVNELAMLCFDQGVDPWEVIDAAASKPFGYMAFYPGPGVGGHCIPLDPTYLAWQSRRDTGRRFRLVELAQDINTEMPAHVAGRIAEVLNDHGRAVRGARILVLGVTYKPDVGDLRESAAVRVMEHLHRRGAALTFHDPFIDTVDDGVGEQAPVLARRVELDEAGLAEVELVALLTAHAAYDLDWVVRHAPLLFDARNATGPRSEEHIVRL